MGICGKLGNPIYGIKWKEKETWKTGWEGRKGGKNPQNQWDVTLARAMLGPKAKDKFTLDADQSLLIKSI